MGIIYMALFKVYQLTIPLPVEDGLERCYRELRNRKFRPAEYNTSEPIYIDDLYHWEQHCYRLQLEKTCRSLTDCPRTPDELILGMRNVSQKNWVMARMLKVWIFFADEMDIAWFLVYGSALGALRHEGVIPHDNDIDIGIDVRDWEKVGQYHELLPTDMWFLVPWGPTFMLRDLQSCKHFTAFRGVDAFFLDFWMFDPRPEIITTTFEGMLVNIPVGVEKHLERLYGKNSKYGLGGDYMEFKPHKLKRAGGGGGFTPQKACSAWTPEVAESCGIAMGNDGKWFRKKHFKDLKKCNDGYSIYRWVDDFNKTYNYKNDKSFNKVNVLGGLSPEGWPY